MPSLLLPLWLAFSCALMDCAGATGLLFQKRIRLTSGTLSDLYGIAACDFHRACATGRELILFSDHPRAHLAGPCCENAMVSPQDCMDPEFNAVCACLHSKIHLVVKPWSAWEKHALQSHHTDPIGGTQNERKIGNNTTAMPQNQTRSRLKLGNTWLINKWTPKLTHNPSHFAMMQLHFYSWMVRMVRNNIPLPRIDRFVYQDAVSMQTFEQNVYNLSLVELMKHQSVVPEVHFAGELHHPMCFERIYFSPQTELYGGPVDLRQWYDASMHLMNISQAPRDRTAPPYVIFLYRTEGNALRAVLNRDEVTAAALELGVKLHWVTISSQTPPDEQARVFNNFTIMFTSHSSQLANLVFARRGSAVVENLVKPYNLSFKRLGETMGLKYTITTGHASANKAHAEELKTCSGPHYGGRCKYGRYVYDDMYLNIDFFKRDLRAALDFVNSQE